MKATDKTNTTGTNGAGISEFTISFYTKCEKSRSGPKIRSFMLVIKHYILIGHPLPSKSWNNRVSEILPNDILTQKHFFLGSLMELDLIMVTIHFQNKIFMILNYKTNSFHKQPGSETYFYFWPYQTSRDHSFSTYAQFPENHFWNPGTHTYVCISGGTKCWFSGNFRTS